MNQKGFTIVEVVIALFIAGVLAAIAIPRFSQTNTKEKIRGQAKKLQAELVSVRLNAIQQRRRATVYFSPQQTTFTIYSSESSASVVKTTVTKYPFVMKRKTGSTLASLTNSTSDCIEFGVNGLTDSTTCTNSNMTLVVTPVTYGGGSNCVVVGSAKINIGRMDNVSTCSIW